MGASRAVLLPRIKPRRRFFGGGSENEDPTGCATPHPDKKTRSRADDPLTRAQSDSCGNAEPSEPVDPGGGDACGPERPGRHDRTASASSVSIPRVLYSEYVSYSHQGIPIPGYGYVTFTVGGLDRCYM